MRRASAHHSISSRLLKKSTCHERSEARRGGLLLVENKQEQIPSLRSGQALRSAQDDMVGVSSAACESNFVS
jgi:hypothetical protein